jgi:hypothetical protein
MVRAAEEFTWAVGTYMIEADGGGTQPTIWLCVVPQRRWATTRTRLRHRPWHVAVGR